MNVEIGRDEGGDFGSEEGGDYDSEDGDTDSVLGGDYEREGILCEFGDSDSDDSGILTMRRVGTLTVRKWDFELSSEVVKILVVSRVEILTVK